MATTTTITRGDPGPGRIRVGVAAAVCCTALAGLAVCSFWGDDKPVGPGRGDRYPLRADRLVVSPPADAPGPPVVGPWDATIAAFDTQPGGRTLDPAGLDPETAAALQNSLDAAFGTPSGPTVPGLADAVPGVSLAPDRLAAGAEVFAGRNQCSHCHGATGDGRGLSAAWLLPHPRDFRPGVFKTADGAAKPGVGRLRRLLRDGVPGTAMPAFDLLPDPDVDAVLGYLVHLSVRGEVEFRVARAALDEDGGGLTAADVPAAVAAETVKVVGEWARGAGPVVEVAGGSAGRGAAVYASAKAGCVSCHGPTGQGGTWRYDVWGTLVRPAGLTQKPGDYRWGHAAADIAGHVRGGIAGSRMPAAAGLTEAEVADLTAFVRSLGTR